MGTFSVALSISSFVFLTIIFFLFNSKKNVDTFEVNLFSKMLITTIIGITIDIIGYFTFQVLSTDSIINIVIAKMYLIYYFLWGYFFTIYVISISTEKIKNKYKKILNIYLTLTILLLVFLPINLYNDGITSYSYGPSVNINYFMSFCFIIIILYYVFKNIKNIIQKKYIPLIVYVLVGGIVMLIQQSNPKITLMAFFQAIIIFLMYHTIENPDVKMLNELELAKQNAERANEAKTDFLSSMSHEIRTPLNAIVGFSNSILEDESLEEAKAEAKDIIMASGNLLEIVNGILDISKIEAGKMEVVEVEYSLTEVLENIRKLIIPRIGEKPIELKTNFTKDIPAILYGDMNKVREIITNLLTNAVKYTEKGIIDISVQCINTKNKSKLVISVEDTGRGIKPEKIDKLFTKFQRLEEDKNTTLEGTGLGLAITKSLVEMLGGKIVVQSKYGSGSKFTVYLEQKIIKMTKDKTTTIEEENTKEVDYSNKKILIVDDNMLNIKVAARLLRIYKITPDTVLSGAECLDKIKTTKYDLILMDDMMPSISGTETLQELKKDKTFNTPVIVLTANAISGMKEKYLKNGFTDYLAKPIDKLELDRVLKEHLNKENN